jgi:hypothetical protein
VKTVSSRIHVNAQLVDATERVIELPEQTLAVPHRGMPDLEEDDERDPVRHIQEIPEQTLDSAGDDVAAASSPLMDLEEHTEPRRHSPKVTQVGQEVFDDDSARGGVTSDPPVTGEKITSSGVWPVHPLGKHLPPGFVSPQLKNRDQRPREVPRPDAKMAYDATQHQDEAIQFTSGGMQISIHNNHAKNFLDASRVQVGTSMLGRHDDSEGRVARYLVRFITPFQKRPIVLVTTVPEGSQKRNDIGPHPDVFAASVSEIRLDHFVVNVVRVDTFPNNGWGQELYLDWIAMEYDSDYPGPTTGTAPFLPSHPDFPDLEKTGAVTNQPSKVSDEASDWDN